MALVKPRPTTPGRRGMVKVVTPDLHKGEPHDPLLEKQSKHSGRNNHGHITVRHRGGGAKQRYRIIDFKRDKDGIPATNMIPTARRISPCCCTWTASGAISSPPAA